ncbi:MAG: hypothetical protein J07HQX50_01602 [Haloquadratum sp. J07HQX50]|nr:MAG: hypothetical protein J07HQX50_01602 [Haloquadratum sp. J07HQX50]
MISKARVGYKEKRLSLTEEAIDSEMRVSQVQVDFVRWWSTQIRREISVRSDHTWLFESLSP